MEQDIDRSIARLEALAVLRRDLDVRLRADGIGGLRDVLDARSRLLRALRAVSEAELREARNAVDDLQGRLTRLAAHLAELRALHDRVFPAPGG